MYLIIIEFPNHVEMVLTLVPKDKESSFDLVIKIQLLVNSKLKS